MFGGSELYGRRNCFAARFQLMCCIDDGIMPPTQIHRFNEVAAYVASTLRYNIKWDGYVTELTEMIRKKILLNESCSLIEVRMEKDKI
jgi:hypothetical protein